MQQVLAKTNQTSKRQSEHYLNNVFDALLRLS
jgi:hypothetical protein